MRFIDDNILEGNIKEDMVEILKEDFIGSDQHMEFIDLIIVQNLAFGRYVRVIPFIGSTGWSALHALLVVVQHSV